MNLMQLAWSYLRARPLGTLLNVLLLALVPLFRFPTGRLPVTPLDRSTCAQAGLLLVPVFARYRVEDALLARWFHVPIAEMYGRSPCAHADES